MAVKTPNYEDMVSLEIKATPPEYLPALLEIIRVFRESVTLPPADASFRKGMQEALAGETTPVYELWDGIDAE